MEYTQDELDQMSNEDIELAREELTKQYKDTDHHHNPREHARIRDKLIRLHNELTYRAVKPKRIE